MFRLVFSFIYYSYYLYTYKSFWSTLLLVSNLKTLSGNIILLEILYSISFVMFGKINSTYCILIVI